MQDDDIKYLEPLGPIKIPVSIDIPNPEKVVIIEEDNSRFLTNLINLIIGVFMNTDKITTIAGGLAAVCVGVLGSGLILPATTAYAVIVGIGTVSGGIFAWFTNKPNPFVKPEVKP